MAEESFYSFPFWSLISFIDVTELCSHVDRNFAYLETAFCCLRPARIFEIDCLQGVEWLGNCSE